MIGPLRHLGVWALLAAAVSSASAIELSTPVACPAGMLCPVQNLFDHDPGPGVRDFRCGALGYDGHDGIDIRLPSMSVQRAGVAVTAAADGVVMGARDGVTDVGIAGAGREAVKSVECGNGVRLRHEDGFDTQYCHMAKGSIAVKPGDAVRRGQVLGRVGLSGMTEFPHLHLTLRKDGKAVDPYAVDGPSPSCGPTRDAWAPDADAAMRIDAPIALNQGFAAGPVPNERIESGDVAALTLGPDPAALVTYVRVVGLAAGDALRLTLRGPDGRDLTINEIPPVSSPKAQWSAFAGVRRPAEGWPPGDYRGAADILRDGRVLKSSEVSTRVGP